MILSMQKPLVIKMITELKSFSRPKIFQKFPREEFHCP